MKTVLYLDQNYVSHLTRARLGVKVNLAAYYENLYDALREAVRENAAVCPASQSHYSESQLDPRLAPEIYRTLGGLYCGLEFLPWPQILDAQLEQVLYRCMGKDPPNIVWERVFNKSPHRRCPRNPEKIDPFRAEELLEVVRGARELYGTGIPSDQSADYSRLRRDWGSWLLFNVYLRPWASQVAGHRGVLEISGVQHLARLLELFSRLGAKESSSPLAESFLRFLFSDDLMEAPFVDIYSSVAAAIAINRERKPRGSDLDDTLIAATALPYCDVFATDGHMKQLILALKLHKRYDVKVFGSRKADVLHLTALVRDLPGGELTPPAPWSPYARDLRGWYSSSSSSSAAVAPLPSSLPVSL